MAKTPKCPYCGSDSELLPSSKIYTGDRYFGMVYVCKNFPRCDAYVSAHQKTNEPMGTLANKDLRGHRLKAHAQLDKLWKFAPNKQEQRRKVYTLLAKHLNIPLDRCHIGMFDVHMCQKTIKYLIVLHRSLNVETTLPKYDPKVNLL